MEFFGCFLTVEIGFITLFIMTIIVKYYLFLSFTILIFFLSIFYLIYWKVIFPEKISYNQNEEVDFKCIIEPDFDYFECYNYKISFWNISETNIGNCDGVVEIEDESNQNPLDKYVTVFPYDADFDGNRVILSKKIKLLKKGTFDLAISVYALSFEYDNTRYEFYDKKRICIE